MRAKTINEEIISGSVWRSASQQWLIDFIDKGGVIDHGNRFISFSFDSESGGQDNFGGKEIIIEFDEEKILKQGKAQGLGEVEYSEIWMRYHPKVCQYITGYRTKKAYYDQLGVKNDKEAWESEELTWDSIITDNEHEKEIILKKLKDEEGLIKSIKFYVSADIKFINKLKRKNIPYKLTQGIEGDTQLKLFNEAHHFERGLDPKNAMNIGIYDRKKMKEMISFIHMESREAAHQYFGSSSYDLEARMLKAVLWYIYFDNMSPWKAYKKATQKYHGYDRMKIKEVLKRELDIDVTLTANESQHFQRGLDPKDAMDIGLPNKKAVERLINSVWTIEYKTLGKNKIKLIKYGRDDPEGYKREGELPSGQIIEDKDRIARQLLIKDENYKDVIYKIVNPKHIFSYR